MSNILLRQCQLHGGLLSALGCGEHACGLPGRKAIEPDPAAAV